MAPSNGIDSDQPNRRLSFFLLVRPCLRHESRLGYRRVSARDNRKQCVGKRERAAQGARGWRCGFLDGRGDADLAGRS